ncbi:MAG: hypothetical protein HRU20_30810, partial [Pseudomonadales bacterium]|nr:hypothetical protein [Pseudomonadales bacterium]
ASYKKITAAGDQISNTDAAIIQQSLQRVIKSGTLDENYLQALKTVIGNDEELIKGIKTIKALAGLNLLTAGALDLGAVDNLNLASGKQSSMTAPKIQIGNGTEELLALVNDLATVVSTLITDVKALTGSHNAHVHPVTTNGSATSQTGTAAKIVAAAEETSASTSAMQSSLAKITA